MNFFSKTTIWTNAEFIPFKLSVGCAFLFIGSHFHDFFQRFETIILILCATSTIWVYVLWISKMKEKDV